jgi:hypothetical protein
MQRTLTWLYLLAGHLYKYRGYVKLAVCGVILICILLACIQQIEGHALLYSHLQMSYSSDSVGPNDPIGGGH